MPPRRLTAPKPKPSPRQRKRNVVFRFNDLPSEILTEIFIAWSRVDENAPWTAASTCRHWRSVALASGQIWSHITLTLECTQTKKYEWASEENDFAFVTYRTWRFHSPTLWIERSKQAPLSIQILAHSFNAKAMFAIHNVVSSLRGHLPRLRRLTLSVATPDLATTFLEMLFRRGGDSDAVNSNLTLDYLEVGVQVNAASRGVYSLVDPHGPRIDRFWDVAPPARSLVFSRCIPLIRSLDAPLSKTEELILDNVPVESGDLVHHLRIFPSLRTLKLDGITFASTRTLTPRDRLSLHYLNTLSLHAVSTNFCADVLARLDAPNLVSLSLANHGMDELHNLWKKQEGASWSQVMAQFGTAFEEFAQRITSLRSLRLRMCPIDDHHFLRVLQTLPELQELTLEFSLAGSPALRGLTPSKGTKGNSTKIVCPRLQRLRLTNCASLKKDMILELLKMRCAADSQCLPINDISITGCEDLKGVAADIRSSIGSSAPRITVS